MSTTLREAYNNVKIYGILKEKNLEEKTKDGQKSISGKISIATGANDVHIVSVYANEKTKEGNENSVFKGLKTVMNEYVSLAECAKSGRPNSDATYVRITKGNLSLNDYFQGAELKSYPQIKTNFINRVDNVDPDEPFMAQFEVEIFFDSIAREYKDGEETGRVFVNAVLPIYGGKAVPMKFVAQDADVVDYILSNYEAKKTGKIWGDLINSVEIIKTVKKGFGAPKEDVVTNIKHDLLITGGEDNQYDDDNANAYSIDLIKSALAERENELEKLKNESGKDTKKPTTASNNGTFRF